MSDTVIRVENLGKKYAIAHQKQEGYTTLRERIADGTKSLSRRLLSRSGKNMLRSNQEEFWALRDVSFEIKQGDRVGIIGRNGSGKSTLLKILSRITEPTTGRIAIKGQVASLLEVGTGFHPELTGQENIYLNGAILGMSKAEIKRKFDEIVAFAEVEKFLDTPVKRYSSGMYVRLAFAVAAHLEAEILVVDEVLAVGDMQFQQKCLGKMEDVGKEGRTVLFVSHNMGTVRSLCERAILLADGRVAIANDCSLAIAAYMSSTLAEAEGQVVWTNDAEAPGGDEMRLRAIRLIGPNGKICSTFAVDQPIEVEIWYEVKQALRGMRINLWLLTLYGEIAFITTNHNRRPAETSQPGKYKTVCTISGGLLNVGKYIVKIDSDIPGIKILESGGEYLSFTTEGPGNQGSHHSEQWPGVVCPKLDWKITPEKNFVSIIEKANTYGQEGEENN